MSKFQTWEELKKELNITPDEQAEIDLEVEIMQATIDARKRKKMTQKELSEKSGLTQSAIARVEKGLHSPTLQTMIKYLNAIDYKIKIVPKRNSKVISNIQKDK